MEESCLKNSVPGSNCCLVCVPGQAGKTKEKSGATFELGSTFVPESCLKMETTVSFDRAKKQRGTAWHLPNGLPN